jgi:hypothetical protein
LSGCDGVLKADALLHPPPIAAVARHVAAVTHVLQRRLEVVVGADLTVTRNG